MASVLCSVFAMLSSAEVLSGRELARDSSGALLAFPPALAGALEASEHVGLTRLPVVAGLSGLSRESNAAPLGREANALPGGRTELSLLA